MAPKPEVCYAIIPGNAPGERVGIIKRGEMGYYASDIDSKTASIELVKEVVRDLNHQLGVDEIEERAMVTGSMFGWNVPAANTDHQRDAIAEVDAIIKANGVEDAEA